MGKLFTLSIVLIGLIVLSCSTQQVLLNPRDFHANQTIDIQTRDGHTITGTVLLANADALLLRDSNGEEHALLTKNIISARGPRPVFDDNDLIVSEAEIDSIKTSVHVRTYAIVGGLMSAGMSFLFSRMINNEIRNSDNDAPIYITTVTGLSFGTILFARAGDIKDREKAIENILTARSESDYRFSLPDLEDDIFLKEKIDEIMHERQDKEKQIEQLRDEIDDDKKPRDAASGLK